MRKDTRVVVREMAWIELFPWLRILRCFGLAIQLRMLSLAALGLLAMQLGWMATDLIFGVRPIDAWHAAVTPPPGFAAPGDAGVPDAFAPSPHLWEANAVFRPPHIIGRIADAWIVFFDPYYPVEFRWQHFAYDLLRAVWSLLVWSFFGAAITRATALDLTVRERIGVLRMLRFSASRWRYCAGAFLLPLAVMLFLAAGIAFFGLVARTSWGLAAVRTLWPLLYVVGFLIGLLGVGLFVGWPLLVAAVGTEDSDGFDAVSRTYSYVYQRPLNYLLYGLFAFPLLGGLGYLLIQLLVQQGLLLTEWSLAWGSGRVTTAGAGNRAWVQWLPQVFVLSYFWVGMTAIYLLLRYDVDRAELDAVGGLDAVAPPDIGIAPIPPAPAAQPAAPESDSPASPGS